MFGPSGHLYVYFTYGMHYCCNIVAEPAGHGSAVLIRAIEPIYGLAEIKKNRPNITNLKDLTNGPAKLTQSLLIDLRLNGHYLQDMPLRLYLGTMINKRDIVVATRIGIKRGSDLLRRYYIKDNFYVSLTSK